MLKLLDQITFIKNIEEIVENEEVNLMEAICLFCERSGIDIESIPKLITPDLKEKIENEAISLHFLKNKKKKRIKLEE